LAAGLFIVFLAVGVLLSANDAYHRAVMDQVSIPIEEATQYAATRLSGNESIMLVCPSNLFSQDMVQFYLWADGTRHNPVYQYPELPVDTYTPNFNITEFISLCRADNVKVVFLYEYGTTMTYYNSSLNLLQVAYNITDSGKFTPITNQTMFGTDPRRIIEIEFLG
jgi:hypothetical protein